MTVVKAVFLSGIHFINPAMIHPIAIVEKEGKGGRKGR